MAKEINLPQGFERAELEDVTFEQGEEILRYCPSCTKKQGCQMNYKLRFAMGAGNNVVYQNEMFIAVRMPAPFQEGTRVFCSEYESPQSRLPGIQAFSDGVGKLIEIVREEKERQVEVVMPPRENEPTFKFQ